MAVSSIDFKHILGLFLPWVKENFWAEKLRGETVLLQGRGATQVFSFPPYNNLKYWIFLSKIHISPHFFTPFPGR
jgi:hypothetical protein